MAYINQMKIDQYNQTQYNQMNKQQPTKRNKQFDDDTYESTEDYKRKKKLKKQDYSKDRQRKRGEFNEEV